MESTGGHQRVPPLSPVEEVAFAAAGFVENHALPDRGVERASFETAITPANFVPGATRSTGTGFGSHQSDATHMFAEGEGEASTPRNARAQAKRAAQNNLKRKLEGLAARHESGTFLATHWTAQKKKPNRNVSRRRRERVSVWVSRMRATMETKQQKAS